MCRVSPTYRKAPTSPSLVAGYTRPAHLHPAVLPFPFSPATLRRCHPATRAAPTEKQVGGCQPQQADEGGIVRRPAARRQYG